MDSLARRGAPAYARFHVGLTARAARQRYGCVGVADADGDAGWLGAGDAADGDGDGLGPDGSRDGDGLEGDGEGEWLARRCV